eukprot:933434-Pelagomonas_calceolata.AAC.16
MKVLTFNFAHNYPNRSSSRYYSRLASADTQGSCTCCSGCKGSAHTAADARILHIWQWMQGFGTYCGRRKDSAHIAADARILHVQSTCKD